MRQEVALLPLQPALGSDFVNQYGVVCQVGQLGIDALMKEPAQKVAVPGDGHQYVCLLVGNIKVKVPGHLAVVVADVLDQFVVAEGVALCR